MLGRMLGQITLLIKHVYYTCIYTLCIPLGKTKVKNSNPALFILFGMVLFYLVKTT